MAGARQAPRQTSGQASVQGRETYKEDKREKKGLEINGGAAKVGHTNQNRPPGLPDGLITFGSPYQIRTGDLRLERAMS